MSQRIETAVVVTFVKRLTNSRNGNPRYELTTSAGPMRTGTDSGVAYELPNAFRVGEEINLPATIIRDGRGTVIGWEK